MAMSNHPIYYFLTPNLRCRKEITKNSETNQRQKCPITNHPSQSVNPSRILPTKIHTSSTLPFINMLPNLSSTSQNRPSLFNKINRTQLLPIRKCKNLLDLGPKTSIFQFKSSAQLASSMSQPLLITKAETRPTFGAAVCSAL